MASKQIRIRNFGVSLASLAFAAALVPGCAQTGAAPVSTVEVASASLPAVEIASSESFTLSSSRTGRTYQIFVALPEVEAPEAGFPIIYMTDANIRFGAMVDIARAQARGTRNDPNQSAIVVGIGYPEGVNPGRARAVDLTPALGDMPTPEGFGEATDFLHFVLEDLKPDIEARYRVDTDREALFGHSFGGLFALHTLFNQPDAFNAYLVSSPSIWWGERFMHEVRERLLPRLQTTGAQAKVFMSVGELEQVDNPPPPPTNQPLLPGVADRTQVDDAIEMSAFLSEVPGLVTRFHLFSDESHGSVPPAAMSRGVAYFFDPNVVLPEPAAPPGDMTGGTDIVAPTVEAYLAMTPEERYALRLEVRSWPDEPRRIFLRQLKYNLDAGLWYDDHHVLHTERNAMDAAHGTRPIE